MVFGQGNSGKLDLRYDLPDFPPAEVAVVVHAPSSQVIYNIGVQFEDLQEDVSGRATSRNSTNRLESSHALNVKCGARTFSSALLKNSD